MEELEFQEHLNKLKIKVEDGETRCMIEKRGRDISGKWIYLCYPCAAMCSGESILQTHISGKKHKLKLAMRTIWPITIFEQHPYILKEKGTKEGVTTTKQVLQKMAEEVDLHSSDLSELDAKFAKYRNVPCDVQHSLNNTKAPLLGIEYLIEHPPERAHGEPAYHCLLCPKNVPASAVIKHMTNFWHRNSFLMRHFPKAGALLSPYRKLEEYREGVNVIMNRLAHRIEEKYGRMKPVKIEKNEFVKERDLINQWISRGFHFSEKPGVTFEEVVDINLIRSLNKSYDISERKPSFNLSRPRRERRSSSESRSLPVRWQRREPRSSSDSSLSDSSDESRYADSHDGRLRYDRASRHSPHHHSRHDSPRHHSRHDSPRHHSRHDSPRHHSRHDSPCHHSRHDSPRHHSRHDSPRHHSRHDSRPAPEPTRHSPLPSEEKTDKENKYLTHEYKEKLAKDKIQELKESAKKTLAYHEKNPEDHPLYLEEWNKFWVRRFKEVRAEGKDPSKHDFKPEWIEFWTARMKELHDEELRVNIHEIYRKLCLTPPAERERPSGSASSSVERKLPGKRFGDRELERRRSPESRRSPERRRSPSVKRRSPKRRRSLEPRRRRDDNRRDVRTPDYRRSPSRGRSQEKRRSPPRKNRWQSRKSISSLSSRNSDKDSDSESSSPRVVRSHSSGSRPRDLVAPKTEPAESVVAPKTEPAESVVATTEPAECVVATTEPAESVVATLRLLVALEDYLGSVGPKVVDLLTEALRMEKETKNSSEVLLENESATVWIETAVEKLKGAVQAGLVPASAADAVRAAIMRAANTLHQADVLSKRKSRVKGSTRPVVMSSDGDVDRAQIAQEMAEALIAQGKTDVSSEELAQLVDAVVESKNRKRLGEREEGFTPSPPPPARPAPPAPAVTAVSGPAAARQTSQQHRDEVRDGMYDFSDSELKTLLKNFDELSSEEHRILIAYLKKLETREPQRVERLQHYISAAATATSKQDEKKEDPKKDDVETIIIGSDEDDVITVESDDDNYTMNEVIQSATQKVTEDQIRQQVEILKNL